MWQISMLTAGTSFTLSMWQWLGSIINPLSGRSEVPAYMITIRNPPCIVGLINNFPYHIKIHTPLDDVLGPLYTMAICCDHKNFETMVICPWKLIHDWYFESPCRIIENWNGIVCGHGVWDWSVVVFPVLFWTHIVEVDLMQNLVDRES